MEKKKGKKLPGGEQVMVWARQTKVVINRRNRTQKPKLFMTPTSQQTNKLDLQPPNKRLICLKTRKLVLYTAPKSLSKVEFVKIFEIIYWKDTKISTHCKKTLFQIPLVSLLRFKVPNFTRNWGKITGRMANSPCLIYLFIKDMEFIIKYMNLW